MRAVNTLLIIIAVLLIGCIMYINTRHEALSLTNDDELVIVAAHYKEDLDWLKKSKWPVVVCGKENQLPHTLESNTKYVCDPVPNVGKEHSSYIKFIVQNYDNLPQYIAFIHGHERSHHQTYDILEELEKGEYKNTGFYTMSRERVYEQWHEGPRMNFQWPQFLEDWDELFRPILKRDPPKKLVSDCCTQIVVSRERIKRHSKEDYQFWLDYMVSHEPVDGKDYGWYFEMMWHVIVGEPDITEDKHMVIVSAHWNEDLEWLKRAECPVVICDKEGAKQHSVESSKLYTCPNIPNKAREASAYLNFIVNNYDNLPDHVVFIHGHEDTKNQPNNNDHQIDEHLFKILFEDRAYKHTDFYTLNKKYANDWNTGFIYFNELVKLWDKLFRPILKRDPPEKLEYMCCAQFVVSRDRIRVYKKDDYKTWLDFTLTHEDDYGASIIMEMMWHVIFGEPDIVKDSRT